MRLKWRPTTPQKNLTPSSLMKMSLWSGKGKFPRESARSFITFREPELSQFISKTERCCARCLFRSHNEHNTYSS